MDFSLTAAFCTVIITTCMVSSTHPDCSIVLHLLKKENECKVQMETDAASLSSSRNKTAGCVVEWDGVSCWPAASEDEVVSVHCPLPLMKPETPPVLISRKCTVRGWSKPNLPYYKACYSDAYEQDEDVRKEKNYFETVKLIYSVGYGVSLAALLIAALLFCCLRKLLCARNYIHLNLFVSFTLRSLAVFIKDDVLFADESTDHCTVSTLRCQAAVTFFHFCVVSNFWWLLVEALYLQTLLLLVFTQTRKLLWIYAVIGWGAPTVTVVIWALLKKQLEDEGCWDDLESRLWWIIKIPILLSICFNFLIFLNISRIIVQKTKATHVNPSETHLYRRLRRSTLLLIPLFGLHYVVFALFPDHVGVGPRLYLELVLGSFQFNMVSSNTLFCPTTDPRKRNKLTSERKTGFIVAVLYCFLNGEVQREIQRLVRSCRPETNTNVINLPTQEDVP